MFCLNSLANVLESPSFADACRCVLEMKMSTGDNGEFQSALTWLSRWIVTQTELFRDAVMTGSFGKIDGTGGTSRDLEHHQDEYLVTAGNGRVHSVSLFSSSRHRCSSHRERYKLQNEETYSRRCQRTRNGNKLVLVINTMKTFCNFYRYYRRLKCRCRCTCLKLITGLEKLIMNYNDRV